MFKDNPLPVCSGCMCYYSYFILINIGSYIIISQAYLPDYKLIKHLSHVFH